MLIREIVNMDRRSQNSLLTGLIIISVLAMYKWVLFPHLNCLYAAQQHNSTISQAIEKNKSAEREIDIRIKKQKELQNQLELSLDRLFTPEQAKDFFGNLQGIFEKTGCVVNSINLVVDKSRTKRKQSQNGSGIINNSAKLSISGGYSSIVGLVAGFQNHTPTVWIESFKMEVIDFNTGLLKCDMTITIYTIQDREGVSWINRGTQN
jgi:hypothetical protein